MYADDNRPTVGARLRPRPGYAEETFREKIGAWEDIWFLSKPYSLTQLAGRVKDAMAGKG